MTPSHRPRSEPRTASPTTLALLGAISASGLTDYYIVRKAGLPRSTISLWRNGTTTPRGAQIDWVLQVIGARLDVTLVPQGKPAETRPPRRKSRKTLPTMAPADLH